MPLDTTIALQGRPVQLPNPLEGYANALAIQGARRQNALGDYTMKRAQRDDEAATVLDSAYRNALDPTTGRVDSVRLLNALAVGGQGRAIPGVQKGLADQAKAGAELEKTQLEGSERKLKLLGGALVTAMRDPSDQTLIPIFDGLDAAGVNTQQIRAKLLAIPDLEQRRQITKSFALGTEHGRQALQAVQPKLEYHTRGSEKIPVQMNALAPDFGRAPAGVTSITMNMSPGEIATDRRAGVAQAETARHNKESEGIQRTAAGALPQSAITQMAQNNVTLSKIDRALNEVDRRPDSFGGKNYLPDAVMQRYDTDGVNARSLVADIAGQRIHDRSGAAVTVGESERLKPYIPNTTDTPEAIKTKLQNLQREYSQMQEELALGKSIVDATRRNNAAKAQGSDSPAPAVGPFHDAEKEARYQKWKAENGRR